MRPSLFFLVFFSIAFSFLDSASFAQNVQLINSGQVIEEADVAYDSGDYVSAIKTLQTIHEADTNYLFMLSRLAEAYHANEQYDKALEVVDVGLKRPSEYRTSFLRTQAQAYGKKGEFEKSEKLFKSAIAEYPTSTIFWYSLGISYFNNKSYEKAIDCFFKVLTISPFHAGSHLHLGKIAILQGRKVHGMFSLGIYLGVNSNDNSTLVLLDNFLDNEVSDEASITPVGTNSAEKLDRIIKARIAMEKDFKSAIPITAAVVKQYELLLDQTGSIQPSEEDKWMKFYLPAYRAIKESQLAEPFIYHLLASSSIETAKKWRAKNEDALKKFYGVVNSELTKHRQFQVIDSYGFSSPTSAWYDRNNVIEAIGNEEGDKRVGRWVYLHPNQNKKAEGAYNNSGAKIGIWKYYHATGVLKSEENYDAGNAVVYFEDRSKKEEFPLKGGKIDGEVRLYYECGSLREKLGYKNGERSGKGESYFVSGRVKETYTHENNLLQGEFRSYYENGVMESQRVYDKGYYNGPYSEYHSNGRLSASGQYTNGVTIGKWTFYHPNGKIARTGEYSTKGIPLKEWRYFDEAGSLTESRNFNDKGERHGENQFYDEGKIHYILHYKNGTMTKAVNYDKSGNITTTNGANSGDFDIKYYYATGQLLGEGILKKGNADGSWKYYDRYGNNTVQSTYKDGMLHGDYRSYFPTGEKKVVCQYVNDQLDGYYIEYYRNGKIKQEGWYQSGSRQQRWVSYHVNGKIESEYYFLNDKMNGPGVAYGVDQTITSQFQYKDDKILEIKLFGPGGVERSMRTETPGGFSTASLFPNKNVRMRYNVKCGLFTGEFLSQNREGKTFIRYDFSENGRNGMYEFNRMDGSRDIEGSYEDGTRSGIWRMYFDNGKLVYEGRYRADRQDSLWIFYFQNGNVSSKSNFVEGMRQGVSQYYTPEGILVLEKLFKDDDMIAYRPVEIGKTHEWIPFNGTGKIEIKNAAGVSLFHQEYKNGERHGQFKTFFSNGQVHELEEYRSGDRSGNHVIYFSNGKVAERGQYEYDEPTGVFEYYNEGGTLQKMETYYLGTQHGKAAIYANGKVAREYTFWNGYIE